MPFLTQVLRRHAIFLAKMLPPLAIGEAIRLQFTVRDKILRRRPNETVHIVFDFSQFTQDASDSLQGLVDVLANIYEECYRTHTLVLWSVVDRQLIDRVEYHMQRRCLPMYIRTRIDNVYNQIDDLYAATEELDDKSQV